MNSDLYFRSNDRKIIATAGCCSFTADTAHEAIHGLCEQVTQAYDSVTAKDILLRLRHLYARIVGVVLECDTSDEPNIWNHDCNAYARNISLST